ncbi:hypothetical protein ACOSQ4_016689 [Xanthoceras sorbifolium]
MIDSPLCVAVAAIRHKHSGASFRLFEGRKVEGAPSTTVRVEKYDPTCRRIAILNERFEFLDIKWVLLYLMEESKSRSFLQLQANDLGFKRKKTEELEVEIKLHSICFLINSNIY